MNWKTVPFEVNFGSDIRRYLNSSSSVKRLVKTPARHSSSGKSVDIEKPTTGVM